MNEFSPATQTVVNTAVEAGGGYGKATPVLHARLAAALEAVADQVVPENAEAVGDKHDDARADQWMRIRYKLLAIAAELRGNTIPTETP